MMSYFFGVLSFVLMNINSLAQGRRIIFELSLPKWSTAKIDFLQIARIWKAGC